jgi:hypothetical protein
VCGGNEGGGRWKIKIETKLGMYMIGWVDRQASLRRNMQAA